MGNRRRKEEREEETVMEEHHHHRRKDSGSCVCSAVAAIKKAQDEAENNNNGSCRNNCFNKMLLSGNGNNNGLDTIPFVLQDKNGDYFSATGAIGKKDCFQTVFFRVESIDKDTCCATLSMLAPDCHLDFDKCCVDPVSLCDVDELERTRHCIEVDLKCFCAIQCLDPDLVAGMDHHHC
ncbi:CotY/CotZ family spore coat protein [Salibacterium aidingense]|uniref:CotY/CotZ family spore coat protein n=1 Tax=Salibacterium aidingense TaxID=384933 RepID=UPI000401F7F1|nr:CotY/CotZ family spore coat protein [Salibacterium aidingense]